MIQNIAKDAEYARKSQALLINISAAKNIAKIMKTNLGPRGTLKMLVGGAGDIRLTKDGNVLLGEMHIQHPTAALIARTATAQDDITGDGTTSIVLLIGEILSVSERYLNEGAHQTSLVEGILMGKKECKVFMDNFVKKINHKETGLIKKIDREVLVNVARTALRTKLRQKLADQMSEIVVDALHCIHTPGKQIDLHMVERMHMQHKLGSDTTLIKGLVLDHGPRHPDMKRDLRNCFILTLNDSLEYEKSEINAGFRYKDAETRKKLSEAERNVVDEKVIKVIELKNKVCGKDPTKNFVVLNQKGIDPLSLEMLAKAGITALRRTKKRNMERIPLACGGEPVNSVSDLSPDVLGWADHVHEVVLGEEKFTFVEVGDYHKTGKCQSCTILFKGPNKHTIAQIKDASRDGLRAVKNAIEADLVVPGAGALEVLLSEHLKEFAKNVKIGRARLGIECLAEALLVIPKTLAQNSGLDTQDCLISMVNAARQKQIPGIDIYTGKIIDPIAMGIFDNYKVKYEMIESSIYTTTQLLYVDEILKAGKRRK